MKEEKSLDPAEELRKEKLEKLEKCFSELESHKPAKLKLLYPTFFVPGWTGENCAAWKEPYKDILKKYKKYYRSAKDWIEEIIDNKDDAHYITFSDEESENSPSFMELGKCLKKQLIDIAQNKPINLVGHSMGGLDIRASILDDGQPKLNVKSVITVGTPNNGTPEAGLFGIGFIRKFVERKFKPHHIAQGHSMYSSGEFIKTINTIENRLKLLNSVDKFYVLMGLRDSVVKGSPKLNKDGIPEVLYEEKVKTIQTSSAEHSGKDGITQDPRLFLPVIKILCGIEMKDDYNYGYIYRKLD